MNSSNVKNKKISMNVSQFKAQLQSIIHNIKKLEHLKTEGATNAISTQIQEKLVNETEALLCNVQKQPKRRLLRAVEKRIIKRVKNSKKRVATMSVGCGNQKCTASSGKLPNVPTDIIEQTKSPVEPDTKAQEYNEFQQFRNYQQAQRYLRTFELLEILHYNRCHDKDLTQAFHENFGHMRAFWNSVLIENTPKRTEARRIEDQWDEVLFGANEKTFYGIGNRKCERERMRDFLTTRRTWDSYLVRNKQHGSCIPLGWALPKSEVSDNWSQFKI